MSETPRRRYILGLGIILLVVLCWVGGDELTQNVFKNLHFDKPFFLVYFKSSMFMLYLLKLLKFIPGAVRSGIRRLTNGRICRSPDDLLGPSSYERSVFNVDQIMIKVLACRFQFIIHMIGRIYSRQTVG